MPDSYDYSQPVKRAPMRLGSIPFLTMTLITFCAVFTAAYWAAPHNDTVTPLSNLVSAILPTPFQIWDHHYLGLFTSFFVHLDIMHLVFNMMWLWKLGSTLEVTIPPWQYVLFILAATIVASCSELILSGQTGAGASGTVYALMGLLWGGGGFHASWRQMANRDNMRLFLVWGVLCIFLTVSHIMNIGNGAHFGGLLFGLAVGYLFYAPRRKLVWIPVLVLMVGVCIVSLTWMPWSSLWNWHEGGKAFQNHQYAKAAASYERALRTGDEQQGPRIGIALSQYSLAVEAFDNNRLEAAKAADARFEEAMKAAIAAEPHGSDSGDTSAPSAEAQLTPMKTYLDAVLKIKQSQKGQ